MYIILKTCIIEIPCPFSFLFPNFIRGDPVLAETFFFFPGPWSKNDTGAFFKAALLSGPPGVGKYLFDLCT